MRRSGVLVLAVVLTAIFPTPVARGAVPVVVVDGRGRGHGVGMAQDGAYWMGKEGASMEQILGHFYPGTGRGSTKGTVRVVVLVSPDNRTTLDFPDGGEVRSPRSGTQRPGFPVQVPPGGSVSITHDGGYRVETLDVPVSPASARAGGTAIDLPSSSTTTTTTRPSTTTSTTMFPAITTPTAPTTSTTRPAVTTTTTRPGTPPTSRPRQRAVVTSSDPVWAGPVRAGGTVSVPDRQLRYRGELEVTAVAGPLRVINEIDVEQYLWGLGEVSAAWPPAALQAQIVAARTYALRAMAANGEICDTERCQVYKGVTGEFSGQVDAVSKTLGIILGFGGHYASAVFSANAAGISATPQEGFGTSDASHPYLVAAPYVTHSDMTWQVRIALGDLARRLGYPGAATSISVATRGPSGRPIDLQIDGDHGPVRARALDAAAAMGLQSTFWSLHVEAADAAPVAPVAAALIQAAPEDVGRVVAEETQRAVHGATPSNASRRTASAPVHRQQKSHGAVPWLLVLIVVGAGVAGVQVLWRER